VASFADEVELAVERCGYYLLEKFQEEHPQARAAATNEVFQQDLAGV
jgi:hypothetical protein